MAPSLNIFGSFFPAWLFCIVVGLVLTMLTRQALTAMRISSELGPPALVYSSIAAVWMFATWLIVFGS